MTRPGPLFITLYLGSPAVHTAGISRLGYRRGPGRVDRCRLPTWYITSYYERWRVTYVKTISNTSMRQLVIDRRIRSLRKLQKILTMSVTLINTSLRLSIE